MTIGGALNSAFGSANSGSTKTDSFLIVGPPCMYESPAPSVVRGVMPGLFNPLARVPFGAAPQFTLVDSVMGGVTRKLVSVLYRRNNVNGNLLVDVGGVW